MEAIRNDSGRERIAIFMPSLRGGGAERVMVALAGNMARKGYAVDLVVTNGEGPYRKEVPDSVRLWDLKSSRVLFCLGSLCRYLRTERPVALLSTMAHANMIALLAMRLTGISMRSVVREANIPRRLNRAGSSTKSRSLLKAMPFFYRWADAVVAVSQGVAEDLQAFGGKLGDKIKVIHNPVIDAELFEKARRPVDHPWFTPGSPPVVLGVGRLVGQKDFPTLIEAFSRVRQTRECRLIILGEGPDRPQLEDLANKLGLQGQVDLPGFVDNPFPFMAHCATYVLSSRWEGLPNALIQAVALGTPVVATDCHSGPREILQGGLWGKLVPVGDAGAMACAVEESLAVPGGDKTCPETFYARYSADTVTDAYLDLLLRA